MMSKSIPFSFFKSLMAIGALYCIPCAVLIYFQPTPYFNGQLLFTALSLFWFGLVGFIFSKSYRIEEVKSLSISGMSVSLSLLVFFLLATWRLIEVKSMSNVKTTLFIFSVCLAQLFILRFANLKSNEIDSFKKVGYVVFCVSALLSIIMVLFKWQIWNGALRDFLYTSWPIVGALNVLFSILIIEFYEINSNLKKWLWRFLQLCLIGGINTYVFCEFFSHRVNLNYAIAKSCLPLVCIIYSLFLFILLLKVIYRSHSKLLHLSHGAFLFVFSVIFTALNFIPNKIHSLGISSFIGYEEMLQKVGQVAYGYPFNFFRVLNDNWVRGQNLGFDFPAFFTNISLVLLLLVFFSIAIMIIVYLIRLVKMRHVH